MTAGTSEPHLASAYLAWVVVCLIWGTTYLGIKIALESIPPFLMGGIRYTISGLVLAAWLIARRRRLPPTSDWGRLAVLGFFMLMLGNGGSNRSYRFLGVPEGHHDLSHHGKNKDKLAGIAKINRFQIETFAAFLQRLEREKLGDGDLLQCEQRPGVVVTAQHDGALAEPQHESMANVVLDRWPHPARA